MAIQTQQQIAQANKASQALGLGTFDEAKRSMSPDQLKPKKEFEVVPPATPTETPALQAQLETPTDYTKDLQDKATTAQTQETKSMEDLLASMLDTKGSTELTTETYAKEGVDALTKELNKYDQQLNVEQNALRRQIERIQDNAEGLSDTQIANRVNEVERQSLRKQADISVIRAGVAQDYATAKAIADRAVAVQLERDKIKNEALKLNYERNKSLFDKSEQRAFESAQADREMALTKEENRLKTISDLSIEALKAGAPTDVAVAMRNVGTVEEALALGGDYLRPKVKPALRQTQVIEQGGKKYLIDTQTGEIIKEFTGGEALLSTQELQNAQKEEMINTVDDLTKDEYLSGAVGPNRLARLSPTSAFTGGKQNFIASVEQLTQGLALDQLVSAKERGATFGALSDAELKMLSETATKINKWAIKEDGQVVGYNASEASFKSELDRIANFAKLDYLLKGGNPENVGVQVLQDGKWAVKNSDGNIVILN